MNAPFIKWGWGMAVKKGDLVNLDGLIKREDLQSKVPAPAGSGGIPVSELALGKHYYGLLRKPHFQRETDDWSVDNVVALIKSYRDGHLIPAVILWTAEGYTFVIDGAHRLSAFIAWVNDDYGDKAISQGFYGHDIPKRQREIAIECRNLLAQENCTYSELAKLTLLAQRNQEQLRWCTNIAKAIETQWVIGDSRTAAISFLAINQRAVPIDPTERYMIERQDAPNVIAARALVKGARGHAYWGEFEPKRVEEVTDHARRIYNCIFEPEDAVPEKHLELQPAGYAHTANGLRIALDLVNVTNEVKGLVAQPNDKTGELTSRYIQKTYGVVKHMAGEASASMGLHPAVYFWSASGNHRPSVFLAVVEFVQELVERHELIKFTMHRAMLEELLLGRSQVAAYLIKKHGPWKKNRGPVRSLLRTILDGLESGKKLDQIEKQLTALESEPAAMEFELQAERNAWKESKAIARHKASLEAARRCPICKARMVYAHMSGDHDVKRVDGGKSSPENTQMTHKFCNTGFKEHFTQKGLPVPEIPFPV